MTLLFVIAIVLLVALVGSLPTWPHSKNWGYYPIGGVRCGDSDPSVSIFFRPLPRAMIAGAGGWGRQARRRTHKSGCGF